MGQSIQIGGRNLLSSINILITNYTK